VDDYHPAESRREAEAMAQVASRLLRGMGNQASRQRMRRDTTMQDELPPRGLALATGELLPQGHSNSARMFLVSLPPLSPDDVRAHGIALTGAQHQRGLYAHAMAVYLQWIAQHWRTLAASLPGRLADLRSDAATAGAHAREPGQVAYLQLAWETFTQCALEHGAISADERQAILTETTTLFLTAVEVHAAILRREQTVPRFLDALRDGFAAKQVYLRGTRDPIPDEPEQWGWTPTTQWDGNAREHVPSFDPKHAALLGYADDTCLYLIPKALEQYLHQAAKAESRVWPGDMTTLLRELEGAGAIRTAKNAKGHVDRELQKKIQRCNQRLIHLWRTAVELPDTGTMEEGDTDVPF